MGVDASSRLVSTRHRTRSARRLRSGVPPRRRGQGRRMIRCSFLILFALIAAPAAVAGRRSDKPAPPKECFILYEIGVGQVRRNPSTICGERLTPASTFKIPHALAALDSGVLTGPDHVFKWDGQPRSFEAWRRDHTLAS